MSTNQKKEGDGNMGLSMDIKKLLADSLFTDSIKGKIVTALNENVNIPIINEKTEAKILDAIYDTVEEIVKKELLGENWENNNVS